MQIGDTYINIIHFSNRKYHTISKSRLRNNMAQKLNHWRLLFQENDDILESNFNSKNMYTLLLLKINLKEILSVK